MFDSHFLTPEVGTYLQDEEDVVLEAMQRGYRRLVEVGCGYGRYLNFAAGHGFDYVGLDIVPWLVEMGQLRVANVRKKFPDAKCRVVLHPAEDIAGISDIAGSREEKTLALFPFNCLGNVSQFEAALDSLKDSKVDVVVSTFKTDGTATKIRKTYYQNCGYEQLNSRLMKEGLLIVSDEGFHAMAYYFNWLMNAFNKRGFDLVATCESGAVGSIYYFEHGERDQTGASEPEKRTSIVSDVILFVLEEHDESGTSSARLLKFKEIPASLKPVEVDLLEGTCQEPLAVGAHVRLALPVVPEKTSDDSYCIDLVGEVIACAGTAGGTFVISVKLSKPEPGLIEKLGATY